MAASTAGCHGIWLSRLLADIRSSAVEGVELRIDNQSAMDLMKSTIFHDKSKHIRTRNHFIR
jgi:hypothetical protein